MPVIYQTDNEIPSFAGINQSGGGYNTSIRYAHYAHNANVKGGNLSPYRAGKAIPQTLKNPIETLARLHRRYWANDNEKNVLVAISDGEVYTKLLDRADDWAMVAHEGSYNGLTNNVCDYLCYEVNTRDGEALDDPVDVLLFTNADDGMFCLYGDTLKIVPVETPHKFGAIAQHFDRIWGTAIIGDTDRLVYSRAYDPFDWSPAGVDEDPADGAGDIQEPSWDGDRFIALRNYGTYLLAFKRDAVWRVAGATPEEFYVRKQYGIGALSENSIAVDNANAYMLGWHGIMRYDGSTVSPFQQDAIREIMDDVNPNARDKACGVIDNHCYLLAVPLGDSEINNAVIRYDVTERAFTLIDGVYVSSFLAFEDRVFYTSADIPGSVYELGAGEVLPVSWTSGFQDNAAKSTVKSNFTLYFRIESNAEYVPMTFRIRTEKKAKTKKVNIVPGKSKRLNINASGRFYRLEIETNGGIDWRLNGGIQIHMELDPD